MKLIDPVGYFDVIALEKSARLLLTDSGGMQKEAYWLKVPCITLRDETEWIETVQLGWNILTGADHDRIIETVRTFRDSRRPSASIWGWQGSGELPESIVGVKQSWSVIRLRFRTQEFHPSERRWWGLLL